MPKALVTEQQLINAINVALANDWPHADRPCRVESLRKTGKINLNWEIDTFSRSGTDLSHALDCDGLRQRVLDELTPKYNVIWDK
jgi:hypothetical protein